MFSQVFVLILNNDNLVTQTKWSLNERKRFNIRVFPHFRMRLNTMSQHVMHSKIVAKRVRAPKSFSLLYTSSGRLKTGVISRGLLAFRRRWDSFSFPFIIFAAVIYQWGHSADFTLKCWGGCNNVTLQLRCWFQIHFADWEPCAT